MGGSTSLRVLRISVALARHGLPGLVRGLARRSWAPPAAGLRRAFEGLGPAFVKLGQFLSVRPDLLVPEALAELESLQDTGAPVLLSEVLRVVEEDLRAPADTLFRSFDPSPLASASVSQVHRAVLPAGNVVAVKVRRPGAARLLREDLALAGRALAALVPWTPLRSRLDPEALWREVTEACEAEMDFRREAETAEAFARSFREWPEVRVPRVHWGLTSRRVLTADFVEGLKISDPRVRERGDYRRLAELGARAFLKQVLEDGLFHADLHPANLLVTPQGEIAYLDFGIVGRLTGEERHAVLGALAGLISRDAPLALRHLRRLGVEVPAGHVEPFARDIGRVIDDALAPRLGDVSVGRIGRGILAAVHRHRVVFPRKYALLVKALLTIEGSARALHPDFSFELAAREYLWERGLRTVRLTQLCEAAWRGAALVGVGALAAAEG
ncbi:MAG: AarF/ABC1/UbiB kinase family protein [Deltaproteobacteria bacterium]|nr:AarF/ABC1/UbiB kinase family protein [Deltaproteobacteria bacterium]